MIGAKFLPFASSSVFSCLSLRQAEQRARFSGGMSSSSRPQSNMPRILADARLQFAVSGSFNTASAQFGHSFSWLDAAVQQHRKAVPCECEVTSRSGNKTTLVCVSIQDADISTNGMQATR